MIKIKTVEEKGKRHIQVKMRGDMGDILDEAKAMVRDINKTISTEIKHETARIHARHEYAQILRETLDEVCRDGLEDMRNMGQENADEEELARRIWESIQPDRREKGEE